MKIAKSLTGVALLVVLTAGTVYGEDVSTVLRAPESYHQAALEYDDGQLFASNPEISRASMEEAVPEADCDAACESACCSSCACGGGCWGTCGAFRRWQARDPWKLPQPCLLKRLGINAGGWLQGGITANADDPVDRFNGPVLTNDRVGELQMNQLWMYLERPCDTGGCGIDVGGRFDVFYGTDYRVAVCHGFGFEDKINGDNQLYGLGVPQFYVEAAVNKLSVKVGRMAGILGYEMIPPMGNFFYSHSYMICYTEPLLITGLMGKYPVTDRLTALAGFHRGIHRFEDNNDRLNFQGGFIWTTCDQRTSLAYALDAGRNDDLALQDEYRHSLFLKHAFTKKFSYVIQNDLGFLNGVPGGADAEWYGIAQYFMYTLNDRWSAGMRIEWFRDDDGTKIMGAGNLPGARGWLGAPGYAGDFTDLTLGLNWRPKPNVILRPEVRWDWYDGPANPNGAFPFPYDAGNSDDQLTLAADCVVIF